MRRLQRKPCLPRAPLGESAYSAARQTAAARSSLRSAQLTSPSPSRISHGRRSNTHSLGDWTMWSGCSPPRRHRRPGRSFGYASRGVSSASPILPKQGGSYDARDPARPSRTCHRARCGRSRPRHGYMTGKRSTEQIAAQTVTVGGDPGVGTYAAQAYLAYKKEAHDAQAQASVRSGITSGHRR